MWYEGAKFRITKHKLLWCEHTVTDADFFKLKKQREWAKSSVHILLDTQLLSVSRLCTKLKVVAEITYILHKAR
jgi:hypothetical protein